MLARSERRSSRPGIRKRGVIAVSNGLRIRNARRFGFQRHRGLVSVLRLGGSVFVYKQRLVVLIIFERLIVKVDRKAVRRVDIENERAAPDYLAAVADRQSNVMVARRFGGRGRRSGVTRRGEGENGRIIRLTRTRISKRNGIRVLFRLAEAIRRSRLDPRKVDRRRMVVLVLRAERRDRNGKVRSRRNIRRGGLHSRNV